MVVCVTSDWMKVCVVGAGLSGLCAIRSCVEEGLDPVCLERDQDIGGTWRYTEETGLARASVPHGLLLNTSRFTSVFSDFPASDQDPWYWDQTQYFGYLRRYAHNFDLLKHVRLGITVKKLVPVEDGDNVVKWKVFYHETDSNRSQMELFDGVMLCSGLFWDPNYPEIRGLDKFGGHILHTHDYRRPEPYHGLKVLVIGLGNSAGECAAEIASGAQQVYVSRGDDGVWVTRRTLLFGLPADMLSNLGILALLPDTMMKKKIFTWLVNLLVTDHDALGLRPKKHLFWEEFPMTSELFVPHLVAGKIKLRPKVSHFEPGHVVYEDGSRDQIDMVLLGTGYKTHLTLLPEELTPISDNRFTAYKNVFLPNPKYGSLCFIGWQRVLGGVAPVSELQARWYTRVITGSVQLPPAEKMKAYINKQTTQKQKKSKAHGIYYPPVPSISLMEELSKEIYVRPNPWRLLLTDPELALCLLFGPPCPARYRLQGQGSWGPAREQVIATSHQLYSCLAPKVSGHPTSSALTLLKTLALFIIMGGTVLSAVIIYFVYKYI